MFVFCRTSIHYSIHSSLKSTVKNVVNYKKNYKASLQLKSKPLCNLNNFIKNVSSSTYYKKLFPSVLTRF